MITRSMPSAKKRSRRRKLRDNGQRAGVGLRSRIDGRGIGVAGLDSQNLHGEYKCFVEPSHHDAYGDSEGRLNNYNTNKRDVGRSQIDRRT